MDFLDVDEETAKDYRSALKINLENSNPELKKRINDSLKIKEMEQYFESKDKLKAALKKIDMDEIHKIMSERKEFSEHRREEAKKRQSEKKKVRHEKRKSDTSSETPNSSPTSATSPETPKTKTVRAKKSKTAENGYLKSDEIIFSSDY